MIAVIDVSGNNLASLSNALQRLQVDFVLTHCPSVIQKSHQVILPGVGTAYAGMQALQKHGLVEILQQLTKPLLGICLGMQLLMESSEEGGSSVRCLGLLSGRAERLPLKAGYPVPHMGWNQLHWQQDSHLSQGLRADDYVYFVHSYALLAKDNAVASCQYSVPLTAIVQQGVVCGMQFHPEKSGEVGLQLLRNFLQWK